MGTKFTPLGTGKLSVFYNFGRKKFDMLAWIELMVSVVIKGLLCILWSCTLIHTLYYAWYIHSTVLCVNLHCLPKATNAWSGEHCPIVVSPPVNNTLTLITWRNLKPLCGTVVISSSWMLCKSIAMSLILFTAVVCTQTKLMTGNWCAYLA